MAHPVLNLRGRRRRLSTAIVSALFCTAVTTFGVTTSAQAAPVCPSGWNTRVADRAVTLCANVWPSPGKYVQIVDFKAGARMRVVSEFASGGGTATTTFKKHTAPEWWDFTNAHPPGPNNGPLFSVINAGFFEPPTDYGPSSLTWAEKAGNSLRTPGFRNDAGANNPYGLRVFGYAWNAASVTLGPFPTGNNPTTVSNNLAGLYDAVVGLDPRATDPANGANWRTWVGARDTDANGSLDRVFLLSSLDNLTVDQANNILGQTYGAQWTYQLDGGGSTQMYAKYAGIPYSISSKGCAAFQCRPVPEVLAVYMTP